jgi:hypothetical protein
MQVVAQIVLPGLNNHKWTLGEASISQSAWTRSEGSNFQSFLLRLERITKYGRP